MGKERRRAERIPYLAEAKFEGQAAANCCRISDISTTGVFIDTISPLPVGSLLRFAFTLAGGVKVAAEGKVVHSQFGIGMGVEFTALSGEGRRALTDLVTGGLSPAGDGQFASLSAAVFRNEAA
jgi:hypothetical protein